MKKENYTLKAEAVELFGQKALFTNERIPLSDLPKELHRATTATETLRQLKTTSL